MKELCYRGHWKVVEVTKDSSDSSSELFQEFDGELCISTNGMSTLTSYGTVDIKWALELPFNEGYLKRFTIYGIAGKYSSPDSINTEQLSITLIDCIPSSARSFTSKLSVIGLDASDYRDVRTKDFMIRFSGNQLDDFLDLNHSKKVKITESDFYGRKYYLAELALSWIHETDSLCMETPCDKLGEHLFLNQDSVVTFHWKCSNSQALPEVLQTIQSFQNFLTILIDHPLEVTEVKFQTEEDEECMLVYRPRFYKKASSDRYASLTKITAFEDCFGQIVTAWLLAERQYPQVISQILEERYAGVYTNARLFALLAALEQYHRVKNPEHTRLDAERFEEIGRQVKQKFDSECANFIDGCLTNDLQLVKRYQECLEILQQAQILSKTKAKPLAYHLSEIRNGYGHTLHSETTSHQLVYYTRVTDSLLKSLILNDLNLFSSVKEQIKEQIQEHSILLEDERKLQDRKG